MWPWSLARKGSNAISLFHFKKCGLIPMKVKTIAFVIAAALAFGGEVLAYSLGHSAGSKVSDASTVSAFNDGWSTAKADDNSICLGMAAQYDFAPEVCEGISR